MARGRVLTDVEREAIREGARGLADGPRRQFCEEQAAILGCSVSTVYRALQQPGGRTRAKRSDTGKLKVPENVLHDMAAMVAQFDYDAEMAIDTWNANHPADERVDIHPETLRRFLRTHGVSRRHNAKDLRPHRRWEAPYPNYLHQMDSTVAAQYFIDRDDSIGYETAVSLNKTKKGNERPRVWLLALVDDHSRVRWGRFYTSNSALAWQDFMLRCWRGFHEDRTTWPAYGVPERLYTDQDSAMKSAINVHALKALEVERLLARPSREHETNAQAKGKAEASIRILQTFEKMTRWSRFSSLEEMNEMLLKHLIWLNSRVHSTTKETPFQRWMRTPIVRVLPPEEITRRMSFRQDERRIASDLTIKLGGRTYQLPQRRPFVDFIGSRVHVHYIEQDLATISVELNGELHDVAAIEAVPDVAGEFKQAETPQRVELKRELLERPLSHIDPRAVADYRIERDSRTYLSRPKEVPTNIAAAAIPERMIRRGKVVDRLQADGLIAVPPTAADRAAMDALFQGRPEISETDLTEWITSRRTDGGAASRAEKRA